jgi:hypothetical protein
MLESNKHALARQQMVLTALGYYSGKLDGIWSAKCIEAKREFECSGKFSPALPNRGLPFDPSKPLPTGLFIDMTERSYNALSCSKFEAERKDLEARLKLSQGASINDDTLLESFGSIVLTSEEDLNAPAFKSEPSSEKVPAPYEPGISQDEVPLETAMPVENHMEEDVPDDFMQAHKDEPVENSLNLDSVSSNERHNSKRDKKRKRQHRPD